MLTQDCERLAMQKIAKTILLAMLLSFVWFPKISGAMLEGGHDSVPDSVVADSLASAADSAAMAQVDSLLNAINLDEVVVTAPMKEVEVHGDTTLINVGAYRLRDGSYLKELVSLVPGLEYDESSGRLTYYGTLLTEVMVNGEKFFGNNILTALENMPAELIGRLKIYDKASEEEMFTGVRTGGKNPVLDIQTKEDFNRMIMAEAELSRGNEDRHQGRIHAFSFETGGDSFSLSGDTGNKHITQGYKKNRHDSVYGSLNKKIGKVSVNASASYNNSRDGDARSSYRESYMITGNRYDYTSGKSDGRNRSWNVSGALGGEISDRTHLNVSGSIGGSTGRSGSTNRSAAFNADPELDIGDPFGSDAIDRVPTGIRVNDDRSTSASRSRHTQNSASVSLTRRLNESGSALTFSAETRNSTGRSRAFNISEILYYQLHSWTGADSVLFRNQYNLSPTRSSGQSVGLSFSQTIGKHFSLNAGYSYELSRERSERSTYDLSPFMDGIPDASPTQLPSGYLDGYVDSLSNHTYSRTIGHQLHLTLNYHSEHIRVMGMFGTTPQRQTLDQKTGVLTGDTVRSSVNMTSMVNATYETGKFNLEFVYNGRSDQPPLSQLMSMTDNSNPLYITHGNPTLKPSYRQDFSLSGRLLRQEFSFSLSYSDVHNDLTQAVFYNPETGVSEVCPVNINGNWSMRSSLWYSKRIKRVRLSGRIGGNYSHQVSLVNEGQSAEPTRSVTLGRTCDMNLDAFYMSSHGLVRADVRWRFNNSCNRLRGTRSYMRDYDFGLSGDYRFLKRFEAGGSVRYSLRNTSMPGARNDEETLLNLNCSWSFLKRQAMKLRFEWNDILNRKKSISRGASSTGVYESRSMVIGSYFMFTLSYEFRHNK